MNEPVDERIVINAFFESLRRYGITPRESFTPIMDGQIHRFSLEGDKGRAKTGAYIIHADGWPVWFIQDFRQGGNMIKQVLDKDLVPHDSRPVISQEEYKRMKTENERKKQENIERQKENEPKLIEKAFSFWHSDAVNQDKVLVNQHSYMLKKQVILPPHTNCYAGINHEGTLIFPLFDSATNKFKSLQFISPPDAEGNSQKKFFKGISTIGVCYFIRRHKGNTLFITEGIATAFSLDEFTHREFSVIAAMNCGNLLEVCKNCRTHHAYTESANQQIIIAADNDKNHAGEIAAKKVIDAGYADGYTMPPIVGYDWNDYINHMKGQNYE